MTAPHLDVESKQQHEHLLSLLQADDLVASIWRGIYIN